MFEPLIGPTYELDAFHKLIIKDKEMLGDLPGLRTKLCVILVSADSV